MAALLRGLRAGTALRGFSCAVLSTVPRGSPPCSGLRRALHCAAPLRLQEDSTSNKDPASTTSSTTSTPPYHEHYQAHPAEQDGTTAAAAAACPEEEPVTASSQEPSASSQEASASDQEASASDTVAEDAPQPDTSFADQDGEQQDEEYETEEQLQARVLTTALEFVPLHGWSTEAIAAAAETVGLSTASTGMFPNGAGDLVLHFISQCNAQLAEILAEQQNQVQLGHAEPKKTADFLRDAVETRLRMLIPYMETWPQAMSILLLPHNIPDSLKHLSTLVDDMWYYAGDRSTDLNWYTKRAALTGIFNTTELVMLQDSSPDFQDTWAFLDNRIQDIIKMAATAKQVKSTGEAVVQGVMGAAITLKNLTGVNQRR